MIVAEVLFTVVELFDEEQLWITIDSRNPSGDSAICR